MKLYILTAIVILPLAASSAFAEPQVYPLPDASFPVSSFGFSLRDIDPSFPDIYFGTDEIGAGGGSNSIYIAPVLLESGFVHPDDPPPTQYDTEVANLFTPGIGVYPVVAGETIDNATGGWIYTTPQFDCCTTMPTLFSVVSGDPFGGNCYTCSAIFPNIPDNEIRYLPFRWRNIGDTEWYYGWVSMKATVSFVPECVDQCIPEPNLLQQATIEYLAIGLESTPNTPIISGGGMCPADFNFDAQLNFFDVSAFLNLFAAGDSRADLTEDGDINFFDISEFLSIFGSSCEL